MFFSTMAKTDLLVNIEGLGFCKHHVTEHMQIRMYSGRRRYHHSPMCLGFRSIYLCFAEEDGSSTAESFLLKQQSVPV